MYCIHSEQSVYIITKERFYKKVGRANIVKYKFILILLYSFIQSVKIKHKLLCNWKWIVFKNELWVTSTFLMYKYSWSYMLNFSTGRITFVCHNLLINTWSLIGYSRTDGISWFSHDLLFTFHYHLIYITPNCTQGHLCFVELFQRPLAERVTPFG